MRIMPLAPRSASVPLAEDFSGSGLGNRVGLHFSLGFLTALRRLLYQIRVECRGTR